MKTRPGLKSRPLRNPGQSLEAELDSLLLGRAAPWLTLAIFCGLYVFYEWLRWAMNDQFHPFMLTVIGAVAMGFSIWRIRLAAKDAKNLRIGLQGERYIGHFLQNHLLRKGYWVVHDIVDEAGNIDHAVIGPAGVFSIETKTRSKSGGQEKVTYDGTRVLVNGIEPDRNPVIQAKAASQSLRRILKEFSAMTVSVRPVVLFPEWYVEAQPKGVETWVLNEKAFVKFLEQEPERLSQDDIFKLAAALGRYVLEQEDKAR